MRQSMASRCQLPSNSRRRKRAWRSGQRFPASALERWRRLLAMKGRRRRLVRVLHFQVEVLESIYLDELQVSKGK
uniref:Uncharacterized protein n=1 Tax=Sphaerodactylus townsendi TaxID=933632 RepID=A0ACB8G1Z2_9SAUR